MKTMTNANETTCYEFISAILHASIAIAKKLINISSEDATGQVDYTIKSLKDLLCITEENHKILRLDMRK